MFVSGGGIERNQPQFQRPLSAKRIDVNKCPADFFQKIYDIFSLKRVLGKCVGSKLTRVIYSYPAQKKELMKKRDAMVANHEIEQLMVPVRRAKNSGIVAELDTVMIAPPDRSFSYEKKVIVVFNGTGGCYEEHLDALKQLSKDTHATIVSFNYRGAAESRGQAESAADLIADGEAVLDYLIDTRAIDPKDILLYGYSMGGGVAAEVYKKRSHPGPIISESSFSSFKSAVCAENGRFIAWVLNKLKWNFSSLSAFNGIGGNKFGIVVNRRDLRVSYEKASLYRKMKATNRKTGAFSSIRRVKIGKKLAHDTLSRENSISLKAGVKTVSAEKKKSINSKSEVESEFLKAIQRVKRAKLMGELRHPHQLVMDHRDDYRSVALSASLQQKLSKLKKQSDLDSLKFLSKKRKMQIDSLEDLSISPEEKISLAKLKSVKAYHRLEQLAKDILDLNQKFAAEDKAAYHQILNMIDHLLNA